jgi:hypothetical protein
MMQGCGAQQSHWQAIGVHHGVNLARQALSRAPHILVIVVRDTHLAQRHQPAMTRRCVANALNLLPLSAI